MTARAIAHHLRGRKSGAGWSAQCPAHKDRNPSLSITENEGRILVHCHAGCEQDRVLNALKAIGLWPEPERCDDTADIEAVYDYTNVDGVLLFQIVRKSGKRFVQRYPDGAGKWVWMKHPQQVLYHLPELIEAPIVFVVEGEKDVETLRYYGFTATTNAGGARAPWLPQFTETLRGREVILIPDNDRPGRERVSNIARALNGNVAHWVVLTLDDTGVKDVTDWFNSGHGELELISRLDGESVSR